jgi:hypothetical protein
MTFTPLLNLILWLVNHIRVIRDILAKIVRGRTIHGITNQGLPSYCFGIGCIPLDDDIPKVNRAITGNTVHPDIKDIIDMWHNLHPLGVWFMIWCLEADCE